MTQLSLKRKIIIAGLFVLGVVLIVIDRTVTPNSYRAVENSPINILCFEGEDCSLSTPSQSLTPITDQIAPLGGTPLPVIREETQTPTPTLQPDRKRVVTPTVSPTISSKIEQEPQLDSSYTFIINEISPSFRQIAQFGFSQKEMVWLGEEFLRSLIRADQQGRDFISRRDFDWITLMLTEARGER